LIYFVSFVPSWLIAFDFKKCYHQLQSEHAD